MTLLRRLGPQLAVLAAILAINGAVFPGFFDIALRNGRFYGSLIDVLNRGAPVAILSIGMTLVIATKGIDLSVGAVMAICGAVAATMVAGGAPIAPTLAAALGLGLVCGLWNGCLVALLDIQPIIATLILMVAGRGIAQLVTEGVILTFNDPVFAAVGSGAFLGVPLPVLTFLGLGILTTLAVRRTALGLLIEAVGVNRQASAFAGINAVFLLFAVYAASGVCAAVAGIIVTADIRGADANNAGLWLELDAILAVVIGGNSLFGGRFSILGSLIGAMIIQAVNTGILLSGFPSEFNLVIKAGIIVLILVIQSPASRTVFGYLRSPGRENVKARQAAE